MSEWEWIVSFKSIWVFLEAFSPPKTIFFLPRSVSLRLPCQLCDLCSLLCSNLALCLHWDGRRVNVGEVNVKKKRHSRSSLITSKCQRKKRFSFQFQSSDVNQRHHTIHTRLGWDEHMRNNYENKKTTQIQTRTKWKINGKKKQIHMRSSLTLEVYPVSIYILTPHCVRELCWDLWYAMALTRILSGTTLAEREN